MSFPNALTNPAQANGPVIVNENLTALAASGMYARNYATSTGLVLGYFGGHIAGSAIADGTTTLAASEANVYVVAHRTTGAVTSATNTTNWNNTGTYGRLYHAVTGASTITTLTDWRSQLGGIFDHGAVSGSIATDTIWDAAGDLAVGTGADAAARLAKGTALQVLRVNSGATALEWATPAGGDADDITYTPTTLADWDGAADPGDVEQALDQLAERVTDVEAGGGGSSLPWFDVTDPAYGATGDGVTDDTTAIASAVTALNSAGGGVIYFPAGTYVTSGGFVFTTPAVIMGDGCGDGFGTFAQSTVTCTSATAKLFDLQEAGSQCKDILLLNTAGSTPSNGAGIYLTNAEGSRITRTVVAGFYINFDYQDGYFWHLTDSTSFSPIQYGARLRSVALPDGGDATIMGCNFLTDITSTAAIFAQSGGGVKITNCKINAYFTGGHTDGIVLDVLSTTQTSIFIVHGCSIENCVQTGFKARNTTTGLWFYITLSATEFGVLGTTYPAVDIVASTTGRFDGVVIVGCTFAGRSSATKTAVELTNIVGGSVGGDNYFNNYTGLLTQTTCSGINTGTTGAQGAQGIPGASGSAGPSSTAGRLTLTSGTPITRTDVTGATNIYFTPYKGNEIMLWDGAAWTSYIFTETTLALGTLSNGTLYDVFGYENAGTLTLEMLAWTNGTTRATAVTWQDGRACKSGDKTRLYLGTFCTSSTTTTEDSRTRRWLVNHYNQARRPLQRSIATASWNYTDTTVRLANGAGDSIVEVLCTGLNDQMIDLTLNQAGGANATSNAVCGGIGEDSSTVVSTEQTGGQVNYTGSAVTVVQNISRLAKQPTAGYHYYSWLEFTSTGGTNVMYGTTAGIRSGLSGWIDG
jgi:hypothetical protein